MRIDAIDILRGLVICLMVLDHVRDFFHAGAFVGDPMALDTGNPALFMTRWVTQLCAPTFVFLAGVSVWLQKSNGKSPADLSRFLVTRGIWLIVLELAVIGIGFNFGFWIFLQVIWAIGFGMIALAALSRLPRLWVLVLGIVIIAGHAALNLIPSTSFGVAEPLWRALAVRGALPTPAGLMLVAYPAIPWLGLMLVGYGLAASLIGPAGLNVRRTALFGAGMLALFVAARAINLFAFDPVPWAQQGDALWSLFSFVSASKYPPSPAYALMTIGLALLLLAAFTRASGPVARVLMTFGRTPLFTYLIHVWIAHGLALCIGVLLGIPARAFFGSLVDPSRLIAAEWGFALPFVYVAWITTLVVMYPLSRWFEALKRRRRDWWLSYL